MDKDSNSTLHDLVKEKFIQNRQRLAVLYDNGDIKEYITYSEMWAASSLVKNSLARHSVENEVVGLCLGQNKHVPAIILGVLSSGAAFYNFEPEGTGFVSQVVQDVHIRILIIDIRFLNLLQELIFQFGGHLSPLGIPDCPHIVLVNLRAIERKCHYNNLAYCITTSGTTGRPKVVQVPHCCIVPNIIHLRDVYKLTCDDLVLLCSPLTFDPSIVELFTSLSVGACVLIVPDTVKFSPRTLLQKISFRNKVTVIQCTPSLLRRWDPANLKDTILRSKSALRVMSLGGEKFPSFSELEKMKASGNQTKFYNLYGITEVSSWAMYWEVTDFGLQNEVKLGVPLLDTEIKICDEDGQRILEGTGKIYIGGAKRQCIIGLEEEMQYDVTVTKWRDTGDIGRITKDGLIYFIGREDTQVKRHGKRLNLEEINQVVSRLQQIGCCTTQMIGSKLVLFIVTNLESKQSSIPYDHIMENPHAGFVKAEGVKKEVMDKINNHLPGHYIPDCVLEIDSIPVTKHGKINLKELEVIYRKSHVLQSRDVNPADCLDRVWKAVLCINCHDSISDSSYFLEAGGDSFKALKLLDSLEFELKCNLPDLLDVLMRKPFRVVCDYLESEFQESRKKRTEGTKSSVTDFKKVSEENMLFIGKTGAETPDVNKNTIEEGTKSNKKAELDGNMQPKSLADTYSGSHENLEKSGDERTDYVNIDNSDSNVTVSNKIIPDGFIQSRVKSNDFKVEKSGNFNLLVIGNDIVGNLMKMESIKQDHKNSKKGNSCIRSSMRSIDLTDGGSESKKVKLNSVGSQQLFSKFIQRGNKLYNIQDSRNIKDFIETEGGTAIDMDCALKDVKTNSGKRLKKCDMGNKQIEMDNKSRSEACEYKGHLKVELKERWRYDTGKCVDASPLLAVSRNGKDDIIFIGSHSHKFSAVSMATGSALWETTLGGRIESSACMSHCGKYVIVGCYDGNVYVIESFTGMIFWQYQTGAEVKSSPTVDLETGLVYVGSHTQCLYALNIEGRQCLWKNDLKCGSIFSSPVVSNSPLRVYVGTLGGCLVAVGAVSIILAHQLTGEDLWRYRFGKPIFSSPCLSSQGIIVGCVDNYLYHVSHSGTLIWKYKTKGPVFSSPAILVYPSMSGHSEVEFFSDLEESADVDSVPCKSFSCFCDRHDTHQVTMNEISKGFENSEEKMTKDVTETEIFSEIFNDKIVFGCHGNEVYGITQDGKLIWQINTSSPVYSTPFIDIVYITDQYYRTKIDDTCGNSYDPIEINTDGTIDEIAQSVIPVSDIDVDQHGDAENPPTCDSLGENNTNHTNVNIDGKADLIGKLSSYPESNINDVNVYDDHLKNIQSCTEYLPNKVLNSSRSDMRNWNFKQDCERQTGDRFKTYNGKTENSSGVFILRAEKRILRDSDEDTKIVPAKAVKHDHQIQTVLDNFQSDATMKRRTSYTGNIQGIDVVAFASVQGTLYVVRLQDGKILCEVELEGETFSSPILHRNCLIIGCRNNNVYCFDIGIAFN